MSAHAEETATVRTLKLGDWLTVESLVFSPDGKMAASAPVNEDKIRVWKLPTGREVRSLPLPPHTYTRLAFAPDSATLAILMQTYDLSPVADETESKMCLWDLETGAMRWSTTLPCQMMLEMSLIFSVEGKMIAAPCFSHMNEQTEELESPHTVRLLDARTGETRCIIPLAEDEDPNSIRFSPDGGELMTNISGAIRYRDVHTGRVVRTLTPSDGFGCAVAFISNGQLMATTDQFFYEMQGGIDEVRGQVKLWDARSGRLLHELPEQEGWIKHVTFSPDGRTLANTSDANLNILLWDVQTGQLQRTLKRQGSDVIKLDFSSDGKILMSCSYDGTVELWRMDEN
jgi:WD40 repeat protein